MNYVTESEIVMAINGLKDVIVQSTRILGICILAQKFTTDNDLNHAGSMFEDIK